jgi:TonB-linked SusC/RagA family outer membrane protein
MTSLRTLLPRPSTGRLSLAWTAALFLALVATPASAQQVVRGVVVDNQGAGLAGAQIVIEGTGVGVLSGPNGSFILIGVPEGQQTLRVTMLGYAETTVAVSAGDTGVRIELSGIAINLDGLVVTGTVGETQRRAVGNSVTSISVEDQMELSPAPDVSNLINARAPGVVVTPGTGMVGGGPTIRIRGASSFSLDTQPLIYVDGVRVDNGFGTGISVQGFGSGVINRLNDVNPEDIASIEIIKGPAASTLYGTEASNGVIQIITKKGRVNETQVSVSIRQGTAWFANPAGRIDQNWGIDPVTNEIFQMDLFAQEAALGNSIFKNGYSQGYGANVRGGSESIRYYVSADLDQADGVEASNDMWRLSTRTNLSVTPTADLDVDVNFGYSQGRTNLACEAGCGGVMWATVFAVPSSRDTEFRGFRSAPPEIWPKATQYWQDFKRTTVSLQVDHSPRTWLSHRLNVGQDAVGEDNNQLTTRLPSDVAFFFGGAQALGAKFFQRRDVATTTFDYSASVNLGVSEGVETSTTFGAQYYRKLTQFITSQGTEFPAPGLTVVDGLAQTFGGEDIIENNTLGFYVQEQVSLSDRLFVTAAVRGDDNSAFGESFDVVVYPKLSVSWVIGEEDFFDIGAISNMKLRAAYGQSGQQPDDFAALRTFQPVTAGNGDAAVTPQFIGNADLAPERGSEYEAGFETGLFDNRVGVDFTYYNSRTRDAILSRELPPSAGFPGSQFINAGEIANSGFEVQISTLAYQSQSVNVDFGLNLSTNSNEVLGLGGVDQGIGFIAAGSQRRVPGFPVASWFRRKVVSAELVGTGVDGRTQNPMCDGGDPNGKTLPDGTPLELGGLAVPCDNAPQLYLGKATPDFEGSLQSTVTLFGQLRLHALVDWKTGYKKLDNNLRARCQVFNSCRESFFPEDYDPALIAEIQSGSPLRSFVFQDAGFAKLREVAASLNLPTSWAARFGSSRASVTLSGRNLFTWSDYTGLDPEASFVEFGFTLLEQNSLPQLAQFLATFNFSY